MPGRLLAFRIVDESFGHRNPLIFQRFSLKHLFQVLLGRLIANVLDHVEVDVEACVVQWIAVVIVNSSYLKADLGN